MRSDLHLKATIVLSLFLLVLNHMALSQTEKPPRYFYPYGTILLDDGNSLPVRKLRIGTDSISYSLSQGGNFKIANEQVISLTLAEGNHSRTGFFVGGAALLVVSSLRFTNSREQITVWSIPISALAGVLAGSTIGFLIPKDKKTFYFKGGG